MVPANIKRENKITVSLQREKLDVNAGMSTLLYKIYLRV